MKFIVSKQELQFHSSLNMYPFMEKYKGTNKVCECGLNPGFLFNDIIMEESKKYKVMILTHVGDYPAEFVPTVQNFSQKNPETQYVIVSTIKKPADVFLPNVHWYTIFSFYSFLSRYSIVIDKPRPTINKHFISLHNRPNWYRQQIFYHFNELELLDKSYFSYLFDTKWVSNNGSDNENIFNNIDKNIPGLYPELSRESLFKSLPYKNFVEENMQKDTNFLSAQPFYNSAAVAIEAETYVIDYTEGNPGFTEKTFKPLIFGNPFLLYSGANSLSLLKSMGFETYSNIIDETYDTIKPYHHRLKFILDEVTRLSNLDLQELSLMIQSVDDVIEHNQNHILSILPVQFEKDLQELEIYIERLLQ